MQTLGEWLREKRGDYPRATVALYTGVSFINIYNYEKDRKLPRIDLFFRLCMFYKVTPDELVSKMAVIFEFDNIH